MPNTKILYMEAAKREFVDRFLNTNPSYHYRPEDGKIDCKKQMAPDPPWAYIKPGQNQNCHFWHHVLFTCLHKQRKVPIPCQQCWKVVLMPRDIEELFASFILIKKLGRPGKCGIEGDRVNTDRFYGAYFYNNSLDEGLECHALVQKELEKRETFEATVLGAPVKVRFDNNELNTLPKVILKRGCTEFEQNVGPSDQWSWDEAQAEIEQIATDMFVQDVVKMNQNEPQLARLAYMWIHKAFQWNDKKYLMFTNGNRLFPPPVTYDDMGEEALKEIRENGKKCSQ